jgi:hypothetical protein
MRSFHSQFPSHFPVYLADSLSLPIPCLSTPFAAREWKEEEEEKAQGWLLLLPVLVLYFVCPVSPPPLRQALPPLAFQVTFCASSPLDSFLSLLRHSRLLSSRKRRRDDNANNNFLIHIHENTLKMRRNSTEIIYSIFLYKIVAFFSRGWGCTFLVRRINQPLLLLHFSGLLPEWPPLVKRKAVKTRNVFVPHSPGLDPSIRDWA